MPTVAKILINCRRPYLRIDMTEGVEEQLEGVVIKSKDLKNEKKI